MTPRGITFQSRELQGAGQLRILIFHVIHTKLKLCALGSLPLFVQSLAEGDRLYFQNQIYHEVTIARSDFLQMKACTQDQETKNDVR